jgi:hypothetical protein
MQSAPALGVLVFASWANWASPVVSAIADRWNTFWANENFKWEESEGEPSEERLGFRVWDPEDPDEWIDFWLDH